MASFEEQLRALDQEIARSGARLSEYELRWRDRQVFLETRGYMLRPRFRPGWKPSWETNGKNPQFCEDFQSLPVSRDFFCQYLLTP